MTKPEDLNRLPRYLSHKTVRAAEMVGFDLSNRIRKTVTVQLPDGHLHVIDVPDSFDAREAPVAGDFLVVYGAGSDLYLSWSPRQAFLGGYMLQQAEQLSPADIEAVADILTQRAHEPDGGAAAAAQAVLNAGTPPVIEIPPPPPEPQPAAAPKAKTTRKPKATQPAVSQPDTPPTEEA